ncbi:MAG TPA: NAD(P)/FAD-dependent oxidoreductase [Desulfobulbus sp.]|nr:NAD(P)/FAD-dependent oxidoreductase [Desulfobulbus sp.]
MSIAFYRKPKEMFPEQLIFPVLPGPRSKKSCGVILFSAVTSEVKDKDHGQTGMQSTDFVENIIIGAGPGGLACGAHLARNGRRVLILERKDSIGPKVCAGGITWSGLLRHVPESLLERSFCDQYVHTNLQHIRVHEQDPIIATINRETLGKWMAKTAEQAGAAILTGTRAHTITPEHIIVSTAKGKERALAYTNLIGADGSTSIVRKFLEIPVHNLGIGINYMVSGHCSKMEWHLNTRLFGSGYGWIFPHKDVISIGAFCDRDNLSAADLKQRLLQWAGRQGYDLSGKAAKAALVNSDFQGCFFNNTYLVGDAAGLASGLTGEGIYPAIVSGEAVAKKILDPGYGAPEIEAMVRKQRQHRTVVNLSARHPLFCSLLMEWLVLLLRLKIIDFHTLEMAG